MNQYSIVYLTGVAYEYHATVKAPNARAASDKVRAYCKDGCQILSCIIIEA